MDYKEQIEKVVGKYHSDSSGLRSQLKTLQENLERTESSFYSALNMSLEEMCNAIRVRNGYRAKLTEKEREVIDYVESGEYEKDLKGMPSVFAEIVKKETGTRYKKIKQKMPEEELVVCGYLDHVERMDEGAKKFMISLILPIKYDDRERFGSLERALYEHNVNIGNFNAETSKDGFVILQTKVENDKATEFTKNLITNLGKELPSKLVSADIKYRVVLVREIPEILPPEISLERKEQAMSPLKKLDKEKEEYKYYTVNEATTLLRHKLMDEGRNMPEDNIKKFIWIYSHPSRTGKYFNARHEGRYPFIEKQSFDKCLEDYTFVKVGKKWMIRSREDYDKLSTDIDKNEISVGDTADTLDVNQSTVHRYIIKGELEKTRKGYVSQDSIHKFIRTHIKKGGQVKTVWQKKKQN